MNDLTRFFTLHIAILVGIGALSLDATLFAQESPKNFSHHSAGTYNAPLLSGTSGTYAPVTDFLKYPLAFVLDNLALSSWKEEAHGAVVTEWLFYEAIDSSFEQTTPGVNQLFSQALSEFVDGADRKIASLGEGIGSFLPYILSKEVVVHGHDTAYKLDELETMQLSQNAMDTYMYLKHHIEIFGDYLFAGDATNLQNSDVEGFSSVPDQTYDMVTAHHLYNNFDKLERVAQSIREGLRILKSGGTFRADGLAFYLNDVNREKLLQLIFNPTGKNQELNKIIAGNYAYQVLRVHSKYRHQLDQNKVDACIWNQQFLGEEKMTTQMKQAGMDNEFIHQTIHQAIQMMKNSQGVGTYINTLKAQANDKDYHVCVKELIQAILPYLPDTYFSLKNAPLVAHSNLFYNLEDVDRLLRFQDEIVDPQLKNFVLLIYKY